MCSIFGSTLNDKNILRILGYGGINRGMDATGIASINFNNDDNFYIYKKNKAADTFNWDKVKNADFYLGHTRTTTQGTEKNNENNHPFRSNDGTFVLAHNGMIFNEEALRKEWDIPEVSNIKTDSWVIVQLLEAMKYSTKSDELSIEFIQTVVEVLEGTFALTIYDSVSNNLYFVRYNEPIHYLYDGKDLVYASTRSMIKHGCNFSSLSAFNSDIFTINNDTIREYDLDKRKFTKSKKFENKVKEIGFDYNYRKDNYEESNYEKDAHEGVAACPECNAYSSESEWVGATNNLDNMEATTFDEIIEENDRVFAVCPSCGEVTILGSEEIYQF